MASADPREFFDTMLLPMYERWRREQLAQELAKGAVGYANDLAERLFHHPCLKGQFRTSTDYRDDLARRCSDFGLVRDIADGTKHWIVKRPNARVAGEQQTGPKRFATIDEISIPVDEVGDWDRGEALVVRLKDGTERTLYSILHTVMAFWESELTTRGLWQLSECGKRRGMIFAHQNKQPTKQGDGSLAMIERRTDYAARVTR